MNRGYIQIYTGPGKGKTTAAIGLTVRAISHDLRTEFVYFYKHNKALEVLEELGVEIHGFAKKHPHFFRDIEEEEVRKEALKGIEFVEKIFDEKSLDLLVLDEVIISVRDNFVEEERILKMLDRKPRETELVLTGRGATDGLIERADLVSRLESVKHYYDKGVKAQPGIGY